MSKVYSVSQHSHIFDPPQEDGFECPICEGIFSMDDATEIDEYDQSVCEPCFKYLKEKHGHISGALSDWLEAELGK